MGRPNDSSDDGGAAPNEDGLVEVDHFAEVLEELEDGSESEEGEVGEERAGGEGVGQEVATFGADEEVRDERRWRFVGRVLGGTWQVLKPFRDQGGMGYLFHAKHVRLSEKRYAVKLLPPECGAGDLAATRRFFREARITAVLSEESDGIVVRVDDVNVEDDMPYFVMPELRGTTLRQHLEVEGGFSCEEAIELLTEVVRGVAVAHRHGVVHRDLKPENIFLEKRAGRIRPRIIDFGIAKALDSLTQTLKDRSAIAGTVRYMAPECLRGVPAEPHRGVDVWSLGLVGYELILGRHPWKHLRQNELIALYEAERGLPLLHAVDEGRQVGVSERVAKVIAKALEFDPAKRYRDAVEFLQALERLKVFDPRELMGTRLKGRYVLEKQLGAGGMGVVYLALDEQRGRKTAIKIAAPAIGMSDDDVRQLFDRFDQECEALLKAGDHRHIVRFLDKDRVNKHPYCVMEYVEGETLGQYLETAPSDPNGWRRLLDVLRQIAEALDFVHAGAVVHRDVKPANVIVTADGTAKLVDFGVARVGVSYLTESGVVVGTVGYSAPEQLVPGSGGAVAASDQWALAAIVYRAMTGLVPGEARRRAPGSFSVDEIRDVLSIRATVEVPRRLVAAVMRGLAQNPKDRFGSCQKLVATLASASRGRQIAIAARRVKESATTPVERPRERPDEIASSRPRRSLARVLMTLGVVAGAFVVAGAGLWWARSGDDEVKKEVERRVSARASAGATSESKGAAIIPTRPSVEPASKKLERPRVKVITSAEGKEETGVVLHVDGLEVVTPAFVEDVSTDRLRVEVADRRFRRTTTTCAASEAICRVELRQKARKARPPRSTKPGEVEDGLIRFVCREDKDCPADRRCVSNSCVKRDAGISK